MDKPTLVVLAAGMGSRYGGLKQVDSVGPSGEAILDYSVFDAIRGGFGKIVFVIRRDFEEEFRRKVGAKYEGSVDVGYAFQSMDDLPAPYSVPEGRTKPWGTAHATRAARNVVDGPFAAINADDFYGRDSFAKIGAFLSAPQQGGDVLHAAMVGFRLGLTLSENGSVARGICTVDDTGTLISIEEMTKLADAGGGFAQNGPDGAKVPLDALVSMNLWGFPKDFFSALEERFPAWLAENAATEKNEWYLPFAVDSMIKEGKADCRVIPTASRWFGVTYREDKPKVEAAVKALVDSGEYPATLFPA